MQNEDLIRAYKNARKLIEEDPNNKDNIINEYIDLVDKINNNVNNDKINNSINPELSKMFKNPLEIAIYNNFQKYNDKTDKNNDNIIDEINKKNKYDSSRFLASVYDLKYK